MGCSAKTKVGGIETKLTSQGTGQENPRETQKNCLHCIPHQHHPPKAKSLVQTSGYHLPFKIFILDMPSKTKASSKTIPPVTVFPLLGAPTLSKMV